MILEFTNNTGTDLLLECDLEVVEGMSSFAGFFKVSNSITPSSGTGPDTLPPIGTYYAYIEASTPNNGVDRYAHITYTKHQNFTKVKFGYHRIGITMCRFRLQYQTLDDQWKDKLTFPAGHESNGWELLEETISEDNKRIRFYFDEISGNYSDMAFSNIIMSYHSPK